MFGITLFFNCQGQVRPNKYKYGQIRIKQSQTGAKNKDQNKGKVLFPEIGHVTKFQEHTPKKIQALWSLTPGAARPPPAFPGYEKTGKYNFQYFQDMRKSKNSDFQYFQDYR